jgi:hypothetical protein
VIVGPLPHTAHCREGNRYGRGEFCSHLERMHEFAQFAEAGVYGFEAQGELDWLHETVRLRLIIEDVLPEGYDEAIAAAGTACPICDREPSDYELEATTLAAYDTRARARMTKSEMTR